MIPTQPQEPHRQLELTIVFNCPEQMKLDNITEYIRDQVFTDNWCGIFKTNYLTNAAMSLVEAPQPAASVPDAISNMEFAKGLAECFGSAGEFEECGICPLHEKCSRPYTPASTDPCKGDSCIYKQFSKNMRNAGD